MAKFEILPTIPFHQGPYTQPAELPEVVHLDDSALSVMIDFKDHKPATISPNATIDYALNRMKQDNIYVMLVVDQEQMVIGLVSTEDILGEKPIQLIEERRIQREEILIKMVMIPETAIIAFDIEALRLAKVGNVINTLKTLKQHQALVTETQKNTGQSLVRGLFSLSQMSKQLHTSFNNGITEAKTVAEQLQRRKH